MEYTTTARSDWLLNLWTSFAIHLRATRLGFAAENIVTHAGINKDKGLKSLSVLHYFPVLMYNKTTLQLSLYV